MKKYLPLENLIYETKLSKEQVLKKLADSVEAEKPMEFGMQNNSYSKLYVGEVGNSNFEISRVVTFRNSFLPQITGEVYSDIDGAKIKVKMLPHSFVVMFMSIWLGISFLVGLVLTYSAFTQEFTAQFLIPFVLFFVGIAVFFGAFKVESKISIEDLSKIFEAEKIEEL